MRSLQKCGGMGHCTHVMVFLILRVTMSCIQKAEPPKMRWHGTLHPCYGVFNIKGHKDIAYKRWSLQKCGGMGHCTHVMVFLILRFTMSCIRLLEVSPFVTKRCMQNAELPKRRGIHKAEPPCYGVFNIKGHNELHTKGGASKSVVAWDIAPMLWCF